jgi:phage major head subunit gpT-like protein
MPITTGSITKALWPGVNSFFGLSYKERPTQWTDLFDVQKSTKAFEEDVGLSGFGLAVEKSEGSGINYDDARQSFITRYVNRTFGLGFIITEEAIEDAIASYRIAFLGQKEGGALAFSMRQTWEILGANIYNRAFNSSYTFGDGKELCATDHPLYAGGTFANELAVAADLSEASLEQACIDIAGFTNDRGFKIAIMPKTLNISKENMFEATRILKSELQSNSANNDINALKNMGMFPGGVKVNNYFTDTDAWFIRTDCPDGMKYFDRVGLEFKPDNDFDSGNAKFKARRRGSFGNSDPRALFGSPGA